ncbi:VOC family protein [Agrococcus sp. ProA11]|uniref:VOC family protein n=1 Tax=Agrococcus chionoecetis TaxID=3153752 RepID=UPI00326125F7
MSLVVHFEIHASEPQRLIDFYSGLLGWRFTRFGELEYWSIDTGSGAVQQGADGEPQPGMGINGGLTRRRGPAPAAGAPVVGANLVVGVDDVDASFTRGLALGGVEALAPHDMPGVGRLAYLLDPDGNVFGMVSPQRTDGTTEIDAADVDLERPMHGESQPLDPMRVTPEP